MAIVGAAASVPILLRIALLAEKDVKASATDLRGFLTDLFVAAIVALVVRAIATRSRWALLLLLPWSVANYAAYEFTRVMNALPPWQSAHFLTDGLFVQASVIVVSRPLLCFAAIAAPFAVAYRPRRVAGGSALGRRSRIAFASGVTLAGVVSVWPASGETLRWRQTNFIADNALDLLHLGKRASEADAELAPERRAELERLFRADLSGKSSIQAQRPRPNVILVLLEGISGLDLPSIAERHGGSASTPMLGLDAIGRENVMFESFITHHRGTNRGLYASLCGDYDKLGTGVAKMTELADGPDVECVPAILRSSGYRTVYLQAAPLAFMLKDSFMPRIGFTDVLGGERFTHAYARSHWGVDDRAFFEQTRMFIKELRNGGKPWFLTLLTVGTHHPFPVPSEFESADPPGSFQRAARYSDAAIFAFLKGLADDGVRDDTIILVSSDESHGVEAGGDDLTKLLSQNLSFMVALLPTRDRARVGDLVAQSDTALSILDVTGLGDAPTSESRLIGRSAFRTYDRPREVFIANQNARTLGMVDSSQHDVWSCDEHFAACAHFAPTSPSFVSSARRMLPTSGDGIAFLRAAQQLAAGDSRSARSPYRTIRLSADRPVPVTSKDDQLLFAGQYLEIPAGAWLDVELEAEALGDHGDVAFHADLAAEAANVILSEPAPFVLTAGEVAVLRFSHRATETRRWVEVRAWARSLGDTPVAITFRNAVLRISQDDARASAAPEFREKRRAGNR